MAKKVKNGHLISISEARSRRNRTSEATSHKVIEFVVELLGGPIPLEEIVIRKIQIAENHTLHDLHCLLHTAFDREMNGPYEFLFGAPYDVDARRYTGGFDFDDPFSSDFEEFDHSPEPTEQCSIASLELNVGQTFGYLFDFCDEWLHRLTVASISTVKGQLSSPTIVERIGPSPIIPEDDYDLFEEEDEFEWTDVDDEFPLTTLYGPYMAEQGPDPKHWLEMDELERLLLVSEAHSKSSTTESPTLESTIVHAVIHCLAETCLAEGDTTCLAEQLASQKLGMNRHQSIHQTGQRLLQNLLGKEQLTDLYSDIKVKSDN